MFGHHPYTNIDGLDPDIVTTEDVSILIENMFNSSTVVTF